MTQPLLSVRNLSIDYIGEEKDFRAVDDVSFDVAPGEVFGLAANPAAARAPSPSPSAVCTDRRR